MLLKRQPRPSVPFAQKLVMHHYLLGLFGAADFGQLAEHLKSESLEGLDENNTHRFYHALCLHLPSERRPELPDDLLLEYDQSIVAVTHQLNERRLTRSDPPIVWKYFQYLALLFTEIYLDRYFRDPQALLSALNGEVAVFNQGQTEADHISPLDENADPYPQLNKLAFWMATGSGKTLLMHAHIRQYQHYIKGRELNRILLLTPNEGLSQQHLHEFEAAGIQAEIFNKDGRSLFVGQTVEIIEVSKLKDEAGDKTVAVESFEGNNLVLVDEGHRGASSGDEGTWMRFRNTLCEKGFSFEYSATFGQAVKNDAALTDLYSRSILFDYSYKWFYNDGFGKDYHILNLESDDDDEWMASYLTACLLAFFQQQRLYRDREEIFRPFNLERPLWVFVGGRVTQGLAKKDASDVVAILRFLSDYVSNRRRSIERIEQVLIHGLVSAAGQNLFAGRFAYLTTSGLSAEQIFDETLAMLFNAPTAGALHVENLKGASGEVALRLGENEPFGVINVGDATKLVRLCEREGIEVAEREFAGSLFLTINRTDSTVNLLIGARKFNEGWNSWRVSTMGLMNVGQGEGSQIIQLFGRGVRLKGYGLCLKRSDRGELPDGMERPAGIDVLETLHIFGIRANYMAQFRDFLEEEGLPADNDALELFVPIRKHLGDRPLSTVGIEENIGGSDVREAFRRMGPCPAVRHPQQMDDSPKRYFQDNHVTLNWYPKIRSLASTGGGEESAVNEEILTPKHLAFLDIHDLYLDLSRFIHERGWNLNFSPEGIGDLLADTSWYCIQIPGSEMVFDSLDKVSRWREIALGLLKKYAERTYAYRQREWESGHLTYRNIAKNDPNFPEVQEKGPGYHVTVRKDDPQHDEIVHAIKKIQKAIENDEPIDTPIGPLNALSFDRHLYRPLLCLKPGIVTISHEPLNLGERKFVEDLQKYCKAHPDFAQEKGLYLLRNLSSGGFGFFEAGNFYPDFILWLFDGDRQHVVYIDPKGIRNLGWDDPKLRFSETVKDMEKRLADPNIVLDSFIVSNTPSNEMERLWGRSKADMIERHILFQEEDSYISNMLCEIGLTVPCGDEKASSRRLGFMDGEIKVPDDFDSMGDSEIEKMFEEDE